MATPKKIASTLCSRYIRLRDALDYCRKHGIDLGQFVRPEDIIVQCCTCPKILPWIRMDAGHYHGRGIGGSSGVYFDERNINTQCKPCNGFKGGNIQVYDVFMLEKYGQEVLDELELKDRIGSYKSQYAFIGIMYKQMYEKLLEELRRMKC